MKPMLASDWDENKVRFPVIAQPKIDGVRGLNLHGNLTGRSLKVHANNFTTAMFSGEAFIGFDGELAAERETHPALCRLTTSALNTIGGEPFLLWWLFDYLTPQTLNLAYLDRLYALTERIRELQRPNGLYAGCYRLRAIPWELINNRDELEAFDASNLEAGYEGTCIRDPNGRYKQGRSTVREGGLLRIKRFIEEDAVVKAIVEGRSNQNEAKINELGLTERSTHQENMIPNGMVGALECIDVKTQKMITVSAGCMSHDQRRHYFLNQHELINQTIKYKTFPIGVKDKPRMPTFQCIRAPNDM